LVNLKPNELGRHYCLGQGGSNLQLNKLPKIINEFEPVLNLGIQAAVVDNNFKDTSVGEITGWVQSHACSVNFFSY